MKKTFSILLTISILLQPNFVLAQTTSSNLQRFRPGVDIQTTSKKIGGISFSGVGSSVLGCVNVGGKVVNGISSLFKNSASNVAKRTALSSALAGIGSGIEQTVPVKSETNDKKLEEIKKKETCLDAIANTLAKQALAQVTNKTLAWINTGLDGNPFYVKNIDSFLGDIKNQQVRSYLNIANNINKRDGDAVSTSVTYKILEMITGRQYQAPTALTPLEQKYEDFTNDFSKGGWNSWYRMTQLGENPIAGVLTTSEQLGKNIAQQQELAKQELAQGGGYLSAKKCVQYYPYDPINDAGAINENGNTLRCAKYEVTTPGSAIEAQANTVLTSSTRQLEAADELNEVLGAFFDNMLNKLIQKGLNGLHRDTARSLGGNFYSPSLITSGNVGGLSMGYQSVDSGYSTQDFDISRPQQIRAVLKTQYDFLSTAQDSQVALERILPSLGALDYCIPGPNPSWTSGLNENYQSFISSFETPTKGRSTLNAILSTFPIIGGLFGTEDKEISYALTGNPILFDKVTQTNVPISPWMYLYYTKDYTRGVKNTDGDWIRGFVNAGYDRIVKRYQRDFTPEAITALFTAVDPNTAYATGAIKESLKETANLIDYREAIATIDPQYDEIISQKQDQVAELESIREEALAIVKVAKARYIANQAAAGTPVNLSCINQAYIIDESPVDVRPRQESDAPNPMIDKYLEANDYFYRNL
jgi:hypothetical protein